MDKLRKMCLGILVLWLILLCGCAEAGGGPSAGSSPESDTASGPLVSEELPLEESSPIFITFEGTDLDGNTVSQDIFSQSKLTMVNVWATYCNPCLREMPGLGELAEEYDGSEFQIIGIVSDVMEGEDQTLVESLVQQTGAQYASVSGVPTTFFFDGDGMYLGGVVGSAEKSAWEEIVNGLLEAQ